MLHYKIFCGNSNNVPGIESGSVHFIFTSPPYGLKNLITYDANNPENIGNYEKDEYLELMRPIYKECYRVLKTGRKMIINITDAVTKAEDGKASHYRTTQKTLDLLEEIGFVFEQNIIWWKGQTVGFHTNVSSRPGSSVLTHCYENCLLVRKPGETDWSHLTKEEREAGELSSEFIGKYMFDLWKVDSESQKTFHPAPFPKELAKIGIRLFTFPNEIVYDPFLGTGTTISASMDIQRSAYGTELGYVPTMKDADGNRVPDGTNWLDRTKECIGWGNANLASDEILYYVLNTDGTPIESSEVKGLGRDKLLEETSHSKGSNLFGYGLEIKTKTSKPEEVKLPESDEPEWKPNPEHWQKQKKMI